MSYSDLKDYPDMIQLTKDIECQLDIGAQIKPFDVYQGPFIAVCFDSKPIGENTQRLTYWNLSIWYSSEYPDMYIIEYKHKFSKSLFADEIIEKLYKIKRNWKSPFK